MWNEIASEKYLIIDLYGLFLDEETHSLLKLGSSCNETTIWTFL